MAFNFLGGIPDSKGLVVRFDEFGEEVVGKVEFFDSSTGKLGLIVEDEDRHAPCLQLFYQRDCENCRIVKEKPERTEDTEANMTSIKEGSYVHADPECQSETKVIKAHMTEDEMKKVFKDVNPRVPHFRGDLCRRRDDNPHLRNLVHINLEKLLCGAPPPGEPEMQIQHSGIKFMGLTKENDDILR